MKRIILMICLLLLLMVGCKNTEIKSGPNSNANTLSQQNISGDDTTPETGADIADSEDNIQTSEVLTHAKVVGDVLNMRNLPTTESAIVGKVFSGGVYEILSEKIVYMNGEEQIWYRIAVNDYEGWIAGWFCELTDDDVIDYNARMDEVEIDISAYYLHGYVLNFDELIDWDDYQISYEINDEVVSIEQSFPVVSNGKLEIKLKDSLGRSSVIDWPITVVVEDEINKALYESMSFDSRIIGFEKDVNLEYDDTAEAFLSIIDGKLSGWYKAKYKDKTCYYYNYDYFHANAFIDFYKFNFQFENGETLILESKGQIDKKLSSMGIIILEESHYKNTVVNIYSGDVYYFNGMIIGENQHFIVNYQQFYESLEKKESEERLLQLYSLTSEGLKLIYKETGINLGISDVRVEDNTVAYSVNYKRKNEWKSTDSHSYKEVYELTVDETKVTRVLHSNQVESINSVDEDEVITVYGQMNEESDVLGEYEHREIANLTFNRTLDNIEGQICNWFNVTLKDGRTGFAYRSRIDADGSRLLMVEPMSIILNNGEVYEFTVDKLFKTTTYLSESLVFKDIITFYYYYEGFNSEFISLEDGSSLDLPMRGEIFVSDDRDYLINLEQYYYEDESYLTLYGIGDQDYDKILRLGTEGHNIYHDEWKDDEYHFKIVTHLGYDGYSYTQEDIKLATLKLIDGKWTLEGEELYDLEIQLNE